MGNAASADTVPEEYGALHDTFPLGPYGTIKPARQNPKSAPVLEQGSQGVRGYSSSAHAIKYLLDTSLRQQGWSAENIYENACAILDEHECRVSLWDCVRGVQSNGVRSEDGEQEVEPNTVRFMRVHRKDVMAALSHGSPVACIVDPVKAMSKGSRSYGALAAVLLSTGGKVRVFCHDPVDVQIPLGDIIEDETAIDCFWSVKPSKVPVSKCVVDTDEIPGPTSSDV
jgi:hypothetical protein